jgi:hypothetical protein
MKRGTLTQNGPMRCPATSRTVHSAHRLAAAHCSSLSPANMSAARRRSTAVSANTSSSGTPSRLKAG